MQAFNSNVMRLALNLRTCSMSVARVTLYNINNESHYSLLLFLAETNQTKATSFTAKNGDPIYYTVLHGKLLTHFSYVAHNFIVEFCHHWIYSSF